ncbi:MAG: YitT family protein [Lachnospiraceae bacterium]
MKKSIKIIAGVLVGNLILAFTVAAFILPHNMIMGGATGLGITINHYTGMDISLVVLGLNAILFILGGIFLGKKFALTTILSSLSYPIFLSGMRAIPLLEHLTTNRLLASIYAGVLLGLGIGIVIKMGSSTGGTDIISLIANKNLHFPLAVCNYVIDFAVLASQLLFSDTEGVLYGILLTLLSSIVLNRVVLSGESQIQLFVISDKYMEIRELLLQRMDVGVTLVNVETGYGKQAQQAILCIVSNRKLYGLNEAIQKVDDKAFITISRINEVRGRGFTLDRDYKVLEKK